MTKEEIELIMNLIRIRMEIFEKKSEEILANSVMNWEIEAMQFQLSYLQNYLLKFQA